MENEIEILNRKLEESRRKELDYQAKNEQLEFDMTMLRRNKDSTSSAKDVLSKKEEELSR